MRCMPDTVLSPAHVLTPSIQQAHDADSVIDYGLQVGRWNTERLGNLTEVTRQSSSRTQAFRL